MHSLRTTAATFAALATLAALGLAAPAARAQDVINFDNFPSQPSATGFSQLVQANNGSPTFDGVTFSPNAFVVGSQSYLGVQSHSGNFAFTPGGQQNTTLGTAKTLYSLYLGQVFSNSASSVTINALGANGLVLGSLTDTLSSTTLALFDTSSLSTFATLPTFSGYSLVSQGTGGKFDFAGDDFNFTAPAAPPSAPVVSGKFDFDTDSVGTSANPTQVSSTFTDTSGGVTATFSSAGGDRVQGGNVPPGGFSGNYLTANPSTPLTVSFASPKTLTQGSLTYYTGGGTFTVQELLGGVPVTGGTFLSTAPFGSLTFGGTAFDSLALTATGGANSLVIDNLGVSSAPEPSPIAALAIGLLGLGALALKARKRQATSSVW